MLRSRFAVTVTTTAILDPGGIGGGEGGGVYGGGGDGGDGGGDGDGGGGRGGLGGGGEGGSLNSPLFATMTTMITTKKQNNTKTQHPNPSGFPLDIPLSQAVLLFVCLTEYSSTCP